MKSFKINYNGNSSRFSNLNYEINANSPRQAVEQFYAKFCDSDYFPQEDGSIYDCDGNIIAGPNDESIKYDGGYFEPEELTNYAQIVEKMRNAALTQRLDKLYAEQVDPNLFEETCDYEKAETGLFFDLDDEIFYFVPYINKDNPDKRAHLSQNPAVFLGFYSADNAITYSLEACITWFEEDNV